MTQAYHINEFYYFGALTFSSYYFCRRELLPEGILYASKDSHYSIFKAARMYRMELQTINTLVNGEIDYEDLQSKLLVNKNKPAIININIGKNTYIYNPTSYNITFGKLVYICV